MKSVLATSENNATKSIAARQERGRMQVWWFVNSINSTNPYPEYDEILWYQTTHKFLVIVNYEVDALLIASTVILEARERKGSKK